MWAHEFDTFFKRIAYIDRGHKKYLPGPYTPRSSPGLFSTLSSSAHYHSQALGRLCSSLGPRQSLSWSVLLIYILVSVFPGLLLFYPQCFFHLWVFSTECTGKGTRRASQYGVSYRSQNNPIAFLKSSGHQERRAWSSHSCCSPKDICLMC